MFNWLTDEMASVKTNKFYVVDGPLSDEQRELFEQAALPFPPSYKEFVNQFGNAKLYRQGAVYLVQVFAVPERAQSERGEPLLYFGRTDLALAYFNESLLVMGSESPVFEWRHEQGLVRAANGFEEWLKSRCDAAKRLFTKKRWQQIEKGPPPFSQQEQGILEARRKFRWRVVGVATNGNIRFEVHNGSAMVLPYLSIGVRGKRGKVDGGIWLPVSSVKPGNTLVIEKDCYKDLLHPDDVEVFEQPDPGPEDRDRYWEFKVLGE